MNAVERNFSDLSPVRPVPTRVLNPNASEASYKPKQRSYRKTKLRKKKKKFFFRGDFGRGDFVGGILSWNRCANAMLSQLGGIRRTALPGDSTSFMT